MSITNDKMHYKYKTTIILFINLQTVTVNKVISNRFYCYCYYISLSFDFTIYSSQNGKCVYIT